MKKTTIPEEENKVTVLGQQQDKLLVLTRGLKQNYVFLYLQLQSFAKEEDLLYFDDNSTSGPAFKFNSPQADTCMSGLKFLLMTA